MSENKYNLLISSLIIRDFIFLFLHFLVLHIDTVLKVKDFFFPPNKYQAENKAVRKNLGKPLSSKYTFRAYYECFRKKDKSKNLLKYLTLRILFCISYG